LFLFNGNENSTGGKPARRRLVLEKISQVECFEAIELRAKRQHSAEIEAIMKPGAARLAAMCSAGVSLFLSGASPTSAMTDPAAIAASRSRDGNSGKTIMLDETSISATAGNTPGPPLLTGMRRQRSRDTESPALFAADLERAFRQFQSEHPSGIRSDAGSEPPSQINLVFHVLSGPSFEGNLSESALIDQVAVLNEAYQPAGLHFSIADVRRYPDSPYFAGDCYPTTAKGIAMKYELAVDPARFVNVYTCKLLLPYIAGSGTFPNEFPEGDPRHGVVIDYGTITGSAPPLDLGHTLVHELGHYFGLLHTFQGGCVDPGDGISDTPAEASPAYGCEIGRDTCPQAGVDPISNFMDYSDDQCTDNFTPLQNARMGALIAAYRPSLVASAFSIGPGMTGNWFDPDESGHGFSIEVLPGNQMLAQWYVFAPDGGQVWIVASGPITGSTAVLQGYREVGAGGRFPPNFDTGQVQGQLWGTLTLTFTDCSNGHVNWQSVIPGYASGSIPITRLTMPAGLTCP
jgi:Pregnancy-associated plasma protein-A